MSRRSTQSTTKMKLVEERKRRESIINTYKRDDTKSSELR
jgi:hypothetical protein